MNVAIIPARGGSKRIPRKNIRLFHGKPIIAYSIEAAKASGLFRKIIVSTDDEEIAFVATRYGAEAQMRPWQLSDDQTGTPEVAAHVLSETQPCKCACVIYATAPLMTPADLDIGYRTMRERHMQYAFSIGTEPLRDAGQWYWGRSIAFTRVLPVFAPHTAMVPIDNARVCDINVEADWRMAERMYADLLLAHDRRVLPSGPEESSRAGHASNDAVVVEAAQRDVAGSGVDSPYGLRLAGSRNLKAPSVAASQEQQHE